MKSLHSFVFIIQLLFQIGVSSPGPYLQLRGTVMSFPFWLGTTMYGNMWKGFSQNENRTDWWWFDRNYWTNLFSDMERNHLNALLFLHPHPYPALIDLSQYPEARYFPKDLLSKYKEMFKWILGEAKRHGIKIYFLTWNICLPQSFASAHNLPEFGADTPLSRSYTRAAVAELFRSYSNLGLVTMAGETPPGCIDFVEDAIVGGLRDSGTNPPLIFWTWCSYPWEAQRILKAYPNTQLMHYLQYEQFFLPKADPRIKKFSKECGNVAMVAIGGPKSAHGYLFWGDPEWAREIIKSLREQNGIGLFIETYIADPWLAREAFSHYAYNLGEKYDEDEWVKKVEERYGCKGMGRRILSAMKNASRIIPRFLLLVHSQTDHYMPQFGLPVVFYLEMPTINTYIFENVQTTDERGYLNPNLGLCYPNPDWGVKVASVWDYAKGKVSEGALTPLQIANELEEYARNCLKETGDLKKQVNENEYFAQLLDRLELNAFLGLHYAEKIRSAVDWAKFKLGEDASSSFLNHLKQSVEHWEKVVEVAERLYPGNLSFWRCEIASPPPWRQNQIWYSYASVVGHWRDHLEPFRRELKILEREISKGREEARLPLWEELLAEPPENLELIFSEDFEGKNDKWVWGPCASLTTQKEEVIEGKGSALFDSREIEGEWHLALQNFQDAFKLEVGRKYQLEFDYKILEEGLDYPDNPFAVAGRTPTGGVPYDIGTGRFWDGTKGAVGHRVVILEPKEYDDYYIFFSLHGKGAVVIDNLRLYMVK